VILFVVFSICPSQPGTLPPMSSPQPSGKPDGGMTFPPSPYLPRPGKGPCPSLAEENPPPPYEQAGHQGPLAEPGPLIWL
jgi:hypothetical protein